MDIQESDPIRKNKKTRLYGPPVRFFGCKKPAITSNELLPDAFYEASF